MNFKMCRTDQNSFKSDNRIDLSDELDHVSLITRRSILLAKKSHLSSVDCNFESGADENGRREILMSRFDGVVKEEEDSADAPVSSSFPSCCTKEAEVQVLAQRPDHASADPGAIGPDLLRNTDVGESTVDHCLRNETCGQYGESYGETHGHVNRNDCSKLIKCSEPYNNKVALGQQVYADALPKIPTLPAVLLKAEVENSGNSLGVTLDGKKSLPGADLTIVNVKSEISEVDDSLDHIVLKERQSMLLSRKLKLAQPLIEGNSKVWSEDFFQHSAEKRKIETHISDGEGEGEVLAAGNDRTCSSGMMPMESSLCWKQLDVPISGNSMNASILSPSVKIKDEPCDESSFHIGKNTRANNLFNIKPVKSEQKSFEELDENEIDYMHLGDRMKLLRSREASNVDLSQYSGCLIKNVPSATNSPLITDSVKPINISLTRKRKKTATDSVETALEEDAPGLLQVLANRGVSVGEIKLYGEMEGDEALEESLSEDSFGELEADMSKLFDQREPYFKFAPLRCTKGSKASYCLACLLSLVEQTRYLQFRKWPVEWGWCRDLLSFIFVFPRHNRIVLERPEYGYATYFFELVHFLPIDWQVKRLVTAMKLTSCSRISLIENKPLVVGKDMTEGEAKVLVGYGWVPNSGLGTMLNYHNRVVHDRMNENDSSEWRSKISKLLMDGYNGGTVVSIGIPEKVVEYRDAQNTEIKLEF